MTVAYLPSAEDIVAAGRLADVLVAVELGGRELPIIRRDRQLPDRLRIVYLVARVGLGEGERVLLAQARHLAALGADVVVLSRAHPDDPGPPRGERRLGPRARLRRVPYGETITDAVPPCDLIVAGSWEFVVPARMLGFAPVVLFERGELQVLGDVPEHIRTVVTASLRAASVIFALGSALRDSLESVHGVAVRDAPGVVDLTTFHPGSRRRSATLGRDAIVLTGCDAHGADCAADAARVASALTSSHPDLPIAYVRTGREAGPPIGELVEAAEEQELAGLLRGARLYVSCADRETLDLGPLEAMASGTPVVATAGADVVPYASDDVNALLVAVHDVDGLVAAARRVLDDRALADRLSVAGLETAGAQSWSAAAPELLAQYKEIVGTAPLAAPMSGFEVTLGGLAFERSGDAARLRARLGACTTREVALPVSQPAFGGYRVVRWRVVARRPDGEEGVTRVYLPASSDRPLDDAPHQVSLELLRAGRAEEALEGFVADCNRATPSEQAVLGRWIVLAMIEADRAEDALQVALAFAHDFPTQPDYVLLAVRAALAARRPFEIAAPMEAMQLLGVGARYDEWFDSPFALLAEDLGLTA